MSWISSNFAEILLKLIMKQRLLFVIMIYLTILVGFALQKPVFMWLATPEGSSHGLGDVADVIWNGLTLDVPMTGYLVALPLLVTIVSCWLPMTLNMKKVLGWYWAVVALLVSLVFVADISLYPFWQFKLDATVFNYLDSPKGAFASVSAWYILWRIILTVAYAAIIFLSLLTPRSSLITKIRGLGERIATTAILVITIVPLAISIRGGLTDSTANIGKAYYSPDEFLNHSAVNPMFSMFYSLGKTEDYSKEYEYFSEAKRKKIFDALYPKKLLTPHSSLLTDTLLADTLLTKKRPNIIIILMEGFGGQFVEAVSGRTNITPNYNKLAKEGIIFTNCYSNSFRTDRGTVSALSGYTSFPQVSIMKIPAKSRTLPCIARTLNENGYKSSFIYGGDINFTNMQSYLRTGGYGEIISDKDFTPAELKDNHWGANDDITFLRLEKMIASQKHSPWHIGYLTLSSHEPFEVPYKRLNEKIPNAFAFTDHCLGKFVEHIKKTPAWRDLLIICIPDHGYPYPKGIPHEEFHHNAMLWIGGAVKGHKVVETIMNQSDMAATLLAQLGISHNDYTFSRNVFSPQYTHPFAYFTYNPGFGFVDSTGFTVFDLVGEKVVENKDVAKGKASQRIAKGKAILQTAFDDLGSR